MLEAHKHNKSWVLIYPLTGVRSHIWWPFNVDMVAEVGTRIDFTNLNSEHNVMSRYKYQANIDL